VPPSPGDQTMNSNPPSTTLKRLWSEHPRRRGEFDYVYPVLSRRSRGLSIGINLNPDKVCNWDCVYCQVDRTVAPARRDVDLEQVRRELDWTLSWAASGAVWDEAAFRDVPQHLRRINDIAFSGDGEPTTYPGFDRVCAMAADRKRAHGLDDVKITVLTNMTMFHRQTVRRGLAILDAHNGEVWAKLDAGTPGYYRKVDRSAGVRDERALEHIAACGRERPIVIQSLFMQLHGEPVPDAEFDAYLDRLEQLIEAGCRIRLVQLYTIARETTEAYATPLTHPQLDALARRFARRLGDLPCETYHGVGTEGGMMNAE